MKVEAKLKEMGLEVPEPPKAAGTYESWTTFQNMVVTSFQLPWRDGNLAYTGRVGTDLSMDEARDCARICALNGIAQLRDAAGDLDRVRLIRLEGHVGCTEDFEQIPQVLNGASELLNEAFGERGLHIRTALGHMVMPLKAPVMLGFWAEVLEA